MLLVAAGLFYTNQANRKQQELAERGQVTERFTKAIDQLGSEKLDVRLGGIYALERLMRDSPADRSNLVEVLSAFVRGHAPHATQESARAATKPDWVPGRHPHPATDVQAALTVLARRPTGGQHETIDLSNLDLTGANLAGANLRWARLRETNLAWADLRGANLADTNLEVSYLSHAWLGQANLAHAEASGADLTKAAMYFADVSGANLALADLTLAFASSVKMIDTNLASAQLVYTDLASADLTRTRLNEANLTGARLRFTSFTGVDLGTAKGVTSELVRCSTVDDSTVLPEGVARPAPGAPWTQECGWDPKWPRPTPSPRR